MSTALRHVATTLLLVVATLGLAASCGDGDEQPTLVFSDLNWTSAQVQTRIAQYITEIGYGYETDTVFGSTLPLFQGLIRGDTAITMEIWLPNQDDAWYPADKRGLAATGT